MTEPRQNWQFGRIYTPDEAWLATAPAEPVIEPDLPIVDPHHHLWQRADHRYLLDELRVDLESGHNVSATVFLECHSRYRADGRPEMRPVGETEFVAGIAAMSESGNYGKTRVAAGIVGAADLTLGDRVEPVLLAHIRAGDGRFRGVRHSAGWDESPVIGNSRGDMRPDAPTSSSSWAAWSTAAPPSISTARRPRLHPKGWPSCGGPMSRPASNCSGRGAACSRATSRSTRWRSATGPCGTPSNASSPAPRPTK